MPIPLPAALKELETAEDFLDHFEVPYDLEVVHISRLHILQRFHDYLNRDESTPADEKELLAAIRASLLRAYDDFVRSDPLTERVFKVHKQAQVKAQLGDKAFVPITAILPVAGAGGTAPPEYQPPANGVEEPAK